jgi:hypothetical protein
MIVRKKAILYMARLYADAALNKNVSILELNAAKLKAMKYTAVNVSAIKI